ncbi:MAG: Kazal-type serine protease inhibitor domain [Pseudomonadota bacterium]|jgi:hypothetical protein
MIAAGRWWYFVLASCCACAEEPIVLLGAEADAARDLDGSVEEYQREQLFLELALTECREDEPVCGADGQTYRNPCHALGSGIEVFKPGRCGP